MADRNPRRASNWKIVCKLCRGEFLGAERMQAVKDHFDAIHRRAPIEMELVWIGRGPAPSATPKIW